MDDESIQFWRNHSDRFLEVVFDGSRRETLENADGYGTATRKCGDTVEIFLTMDKGKIRSASFDTDGCVYSLACASAVTLMVAGKTLQQAVALTPEELSDYLVTLPAAEFHCAELAVRALRIAISDAREMAGNPWKKSYRKILHRSDRT